LKKVYLLLLFLIINFGGLALGSYLMNDGPNSTWYNDLNQAPWTPPGWVFGAAWTVIMICLTKRHGHHQDGFLARHGP